MAMYAKTDAGHRPAASGSVIFRHDKVGILDLLSLVFRRKYLTSYDFVETSGDAARNVEGLVPDPITALVLLVQKFLSGMKTPMKWIGIILEFFLNLFALNRGIFGLIWRMMTCNMVMPYREKQNFKSVLGHIDGRTALFKRNTLVNFMPSLDSQQAQFEGIDLPDLTVMAAKIAYENEAFIKYVVTVEWKMHFLKFYDCWNKFTDVNTTQAFTFCNKEEDADLIIVAFRGTEPFNADDWSTDVDLSHMATGKMGFIHLGFLKALGLQNDTIFSLGFPKQFNNNAAKPMAYYAIRDDLKKLLQKHKNAKIVVTGHSLGAALAIVFPALLAYHDETDIMNALYGAVTYAQPRVGDAIFGNYVETMMRLNYHRIVYRYDIVPRIPFDMNVISMFKHCGTCIYYDGWYKGKLVDEVPNPNYIDITFMIPMYWNAWMDLFKGMIIGKTQGKDYKESMMSLMFRGMGLILPGIASHSPRDYVNSVRLGKITLKEMV